MSCLLRSALHVLLAILKICRWLCHVSLLPHNTFLHPRVSASSGFCCQQYSVQKHCTSMARKKKRPGATAGAIPGYYPVDDNPCQAHNPDRPPTTNNRNLLNRHLPRRMAKNLLEAQIPRMLLLRGNLPPNIEGKYSDAVQLELPTATDPVSSHCQILKTSTRAMRLQRLSRTTC